MLIFLLFKLCTQRNQTHGDAVVAQVQPFLYVHLQRHCQSLLADERAGSQRRRISLQTDASTHYDADVVPLPWNQPVSFGVEIKLFALDLTTNWTWLFLCVSSENYVTPNGPQRALANGPNGSLRRSITNSPFLMSAEQRVTAQGPNPSNRHGPKVTPCTSLSSFIADKFQKESMRRL